MSENTYKPHPEQLALMPEVSGNTINGVGEPSPRQPSPVYWHDPDAIPHGDLQRWFYDHMPPNPALDDARKRRDAIIAKPLSPLAPARKERASKAWMIALSKFIRTEIDAEMWGVAEVQPEWVFEGTKVDGRYLIMLGFAHDHARLATAPSNEALVEIIDQYARGNAASRAISSWFLERGWEATPLGGPMAPPLLLIPPALACGFGELGKHGSIINARYGSNFRLAAVATDAPLRPTQPEDHGIDDFCARCQVCAKACPPGAIGQEKQLVRGVEKWYVDFDRCVPYFNEYQSCGICIAVCPFSLPNRAPKIVQKLARRAARKDQEYEP